MAVAARTHRDRLVLFRRMEASARERGVTHAAERWRQAALDAERSAELISGALEALRVANPPAGPPGDAAA